MFDKSPAVFPVKDRYTYLAHCGVSPLLAAAEKRARAVSLGQVESGAMSFLEFRDLTEELRTAAAQLMKTSPDNLAFVKNTSEGLCMIANGYPLAEGDQIISYVHEYPANHYPWKLQERRGAELVLLPDRNVTGASPGGCPCAWTLEDLEALVTDRTRIVAVSHVQFTSGFAADLARLGSFCRERGIDLVVDAAQSLGCMPVYPEETGVSAVASSGWKWLMGPVGTGLLYTAPELREKLAPVLVGADLMQQGTDYLDHTWNPHPTARCFEYSTTPIALAAALEVCIQELGLRYGPEAICAEVRRLQDLFLSALDRARYVPLLFDETNRSGILALVCRDDPKPVVKALIEKSVICSVRAGLLRIAPHFCTTDAEIRTAAGILNSLPQQPRKETP
jgi:selenocysteine lyase/cysteine desulfurase